MDTLGISGPALPEDPPNQIYDDWASLTPRQMSPELSRDHHVCPALALNPLADELDSGSDSSSLHPGLESPAGDFDCKHRETFSYADSTLTPHVFDQHWIHLTRCLTSAELKRFLLGLQRRYVPKNALSDWTVSNHYPLKHCLIDTMSAFPRSVFSQTEMDAMRWFTTKCGIRGLPTLSDVQRHRKAILQAAGAGTKLVQGALGNSFAVNDLGRILAHVSSPFPPFSDSHQSVADRTFIQEMANPCVRPHLRFYAEDCGKHVSEARHATRWTREVNANFAGPMARLECGGSFIDFYVHEVALANIDTYGTYAPVMPTRWFERTGQLFARAHRLQVNPRRTAYIIDASDCVDIPLSAFFASFAELQYSHHAYGLPPPSKIDGTVPVSPFSIVCFANMRSSRPLVTLLGVLCEGEVREWTEPTENPWRQRANGRRVYALPLWTYCDDTSGNITKRWNEHNSFLFTLAGLPRSIVQLPYNVHFLATSNLASPTEMLAKITDELL